MPADLPGYHYDAATNRYYKIQPNHVAPTGSNYSRQAINADKVIKTTQKREESSKQSKDASTVARAEASDNPILNLDRRLGNLHVSARTYVREYYASSLSPADIFSQPLTMPRVLGQEYKPTGLSEHFAVEETTGSLLTALSYKAPGSRTLSLLLTFDRRNKPSHTLDDPSPSTAIADGEDADNEQNWPATPQADFSGHLYSRQQKRILQSSPKVDCMAWAGPGLVCWTHETQRGGEAVGVNYQSDLTLSHFSAPGRAIGLDMVVKFRFQARILDLATCPSRASLAIATSNGVSFMTDLEYGQQVSSTAVRGEQMKVGFKDEHILMSGSRSGRLMFCDTRSASSTSTSTSTSTSRHHPHPHPQAQASPGFASAAALRLQHSSAISGIAALPDGNRILVNGLTDMKIYDLRYVAAPTPNKPPPRSRQNNKYSRVFAPSTPVVTFNVPATRRQNRYGMGFAYDPELDIVLSASTDNYQNHRVGVWSAASGQLLDSPLNEYRFRDPVTCASISRVRDGPKSILLACAGRIEEWCAQGRGMEGEQE